MVHRGVAGTSTQSPLKKMSQLFCEEVLVCYYRNISVFCVLRSGVLLSEYIRWPSQQEPLFTIITSLCLEPNAQMSHKQAPHNIALVKK